jgi:aspartate aminotransferase
VIRVPLTFPPRKQQMSSAMSNRPQGVILTLDSRVRDLKPSATLAINERSARLRAGGREIFKLGLGQSPFPVPDGVRELLSANAGQKDYLPVRGLTGLREAVAAYHLRKQGIDRQADDVLIGPGSKELIFILQEAFDCEVLLPCPSWVSYAPQAQLAGRRVRWLPTELKDGGRLQPELLAAECGREPDRPRLLILNYPSNPTGMTLNPELLAGLAAVARRYGVLVLSDEIYGDLHHEGTHESIAVHYPEGTIVSAGLSKWCGAGGWRLGTFSLPPELRQLGDAMAVIASETFTSVSAPIQHAAIRAYEGGGEIECYLRRSRAVLRGLGRWVAARLRASGALVDDPEGAFYLMPDFTPMRERLRVAGIHASKDLCERLLMEAGVAMLPGSDFGFPAEALNARLAYVDFDGAAALQALAENGDRLDEDAFLAAHCGRVLEAIERTCSWLGKLEPGAS